MINYETIKKAYEFARDMAASSEDWHWHDIMDILSPPPLEWREISETWIKADRWEIIDENGWELRCEGFADVGDGTIASRDRLKEIAQQLEDVLDGVLPEPPSAPAPAPFKINDRVNWSEKVWRVDWVHDDGLTLVEGPSGHEQWKYHVSPDECTMHDPFDFLAPIDVLDGVFCELETSIENLYDSDYLDLGSRDGLFAILRRRFRGTPEGQKEGS
jgi:hypothetical protein